MSQKEREIAEALRRLRVPQTGMALVRHSGIKRGTMYTTLNRLISKGYAQDHVAIAGDDFSVLQRRYQLTESGRTMLRALARFARDTA